MRRVARLLRFTEGSPAAGFAWMTRAVGLAVRALIMVTVSSLRSRYGAMARGFWLCNRCFLAVIPAKAGIHLLRRYTLSERSSLLGFARHPWRASHFLCLHKESNQRNAPSVTRRPQAAVRCGRPGFGGRASCPVAKCGPSWPAPRAAHAASSVRPSPLHRGSTSRAANPLFLLRQEPRFSFASRVPSRSRRAGGGKARRVAGRMPASLPTVHGRTAGKPRSLLAQSTGMDARRPRPRGCPFLGYFLWASKESDSAARDGGRNHTGTWGGFRDTVKDKSKMDSGLRRNDGGGSLRRNDELGVFRQIDDPRNAQRDHPDNALARSRKNRTAAHEKTHRAAHTAGPRERLNRVRAASMSDSHHPRRACP